MTDKGETIDELNQRLAKGAVLVASLIESQKETGESRQYRFIADRHTAKLLHDTNRGQAITANKRQHKRYTG